MPETGQNKSSEPTLSDLIEPFYAGIPDFTRYKGAITPICWVSVTPDLVSLWLQFIE